MPQISIHREHRLGLARARAIAGRWAEEAQQRFDLQFTTEAGDDADTLSFSRTGINGRLVVGASRFELDASLGVLLGGFSKAIEAEISRNLDRLLAGEDSATEVADAVPRPEAVVPAPVKRKRRSS